MKIITYIIYTVIALGYGFSLLATAPSCETDGTLSSTCKPRAKLDRRSSYQKNNGGLRGKYIGKTIERSSSIYCNPKNCVYESSLPRPNRVFRDGSLLTYDYIPDRLNLSFDSNNKITNVYYG